MNHLADARSAGGLPAEIWHQILSLCDVRTLLNLEGSCRYFKERIFNRSLWLNNLQELGKDRAPDLPCHIAIDSLSTADLRDIVLRSERRYANCMGPEPLKATRRTDIPIGDSNADGSLGTPIVWGADTLLLPGRKYFLTKWPAGYLQCWNTETRELEWSYPRKPEVGQVQDGAVVTFACDMLSDGDIHVAMVCEAFATPDARVLRIMRFGTASGSFTQVYEATPNELDIWHGMPLFLHLSGDICIVYTEGQLMVSAWKRGRMVIITQAILDYAQVVEDLIIGVKNTFDGNSLFAAPVAPLLEKLNEGDSPFCYTPFESVRAASTGITSPRNWLLGRAQLSICKYHWQRNTSPTRRWTVTVFADVYDEDKCCDFPVAMVFALDIEHSELSRTLLGFPTLTLMGRSRLDQVDYEYSTYSAINSPAQAGSTILAFYDDRKPERRFARTFSTFSSDMTVKLKSLDDSMITTRPATYSLNVEFYSGTVYYVSDDLREAVLLSID